MTVGEMDFIKRLPVNALGRDFVCGDLHGSYSCLEKFLDRIYFDENKDRLICCGDLVDRGPENEKCLDLLYEPWFFTTKGNHEQMMEDFFRGRPLGNYWAPNGGRWGIQYGYEIISDIGQRVREIAFNKLGALPYIITVEKKSGGVFHVLHSELDSEVPLTDTDLANEERLVELATRQTRDGDIIMWGRRIFYRLFDTCLDEHSVKKFKKTVFFEKLDRIFGPEHSHIYSGHTNVRRPVRLAGQTNLDTKAWGSYPEQGRYGVVNPAAWCGLTVTEPETDRFWLVNDNQFTETSPLCIM